jgi:hypothetical protein
MTLADCIESEGSKRCGSIHQSRPKKSERLNRSSSIYPKKKKIGVDTLLTPDRNTAG